MLQLDQLKRMVDDASDLMEESRSQGARARDYYNGNQRTAAEAAVLKRRRQPDTTENLIRRKIDALVGLEMQGRVDPKALPRQPDDEDAADLATQALVFCDDITRLDQKRSQVAYNLGIEGFGGVEVVVRQRGQNIDPDVIRLRWEEIFYDPFSREADFSDAQYLGVMKWASVAAATTMLRPYAGEIGDEALADMLDQSLTLGGETYEDRPRGEQAAWGDRKSKRVKVVQMYYLDGGSWNLAVFCGGGEVFNGPSPYLDEYGRPECAIILQSTYVDSENGRHGIVKDMIPVQDEVNKRRSKILHMLNSRQTMGHKGAVVVPAGYRGSVEKYIGEVLADPSGHIEYDQDPSTSVPGFQIIPQMDQITGQFQLLQDGKNSLQMLGPNAALQGQTTGQQSGRAIMAQQQAGMAELAPFYDALRDFSVRVYRAIWNRIRQYWTGPRWIRVTDEDGARFFGANIPQVDASGRVTFINRIAEIDVDIIIDAAPDYVTLQSEQFEMLTNLAQSGVPIPPDVIIEASVLRGKAKLLERLRDPQAQQAQMQQLQAQMAQFQAKLEELQASTRQKNAAAGKLEAEAQQIMLEQGAQEGAGADAVMRASEAQQRLEIDRAKAADDGRLKHAQTIKTMAEAERIGVEARLAPVREMHRQQSPQGGQR